METKTPDCVINWTPVSDGILPANGAVVLLSLGYYDGSRACGVGIVTGDTIRIIAGTPGTVQAWAMLPSPYWGDAPSG